MRVRWLAIFVCFVLFALVAGTPGSASARFDLEYEENVGFEGDPDGGVVGFDVDGGGGGNQPQADAAQEQDRGIQIDQVWKSNLLAALIPAQFLLHSSVLIHLIQDNFWPVVGKRR